MCDNAIFSADTEYVLELKQGEDVQLVYYLGLLAGKLCIEDIDQSNKVKQFAQLLIKKTRLKRK
jgi:hypothetical protein